MSNTSELRELVKRGRSGKNIGKSLGLPKLTKLLGGIQPSRYYLIGAGSSVGKSAMVIYLMYQLLRYSKDPVTLVYYSLELGEDVIQSKLAALYCAEEFGIYLTLDDALSFTQPIGDYEYECFLKGLDWVDSLGSNLRIIDKGLSAKILYASTLSILEEYGTIEQLPDGKEIYHPFDPNRLVVGIIDHMSLIRAEEGRKKKEEMDLTSSEMVTIKRKYKMSWIALMQQNRESSSMDRRKADLSEPTLNDLKDSGSPAEDADVVIQLFSPFREKLVSYRGFKVLGDDGLKDRLRGVIITKNRYGIANQAIVNAFYGEIGWFKEMPDPNEVNNVMRFKNISENVPNKSIDEKEKDSDKTHFKF